MHIQTIRYPEKDNALDSLLKSHGLRLPQDTDESVGIYDGGDLIACGFLKGYTLQGLAVDSSRQGEGISALVVTELIKRAAARGIFHLIVITKPQMSSSLEGIGFKRILDVLPYSVVLEYGFPDIGDYVTELGERRVESKSPIREPADGAGNRKKDRCACIVMNANPFTLGHRYLAERAASENEHVYILVIEEERTFFPFDIRIGLVREGVKDLKNVDVLEGGDYMISSLIFPSYFIGMSELTALEANVDAGLFGKYIAPALDINRRYVGTEPYSEVTGVYNETLKRVLPGYGVEVIETERVKLDDGRVISASALRTALVNNDWKTVELMTPTSTLSYLKSPQARTVIEKGISIT